MLSGELIKRLRHRFAPGALLHYGQGKWYPGEPLPRWALSAFWRKDGVPVWRDDSLIADESKNYGHGAPEAKLLAARLAEVLGVNPQHLIPGYEDAFYYTWKERRLPSNVTPETTNLKDKQERDRIARIFQEGLGSVVGYALPIKRAWYGDKPGWMSGSWFLRDGETLWLIPGDSPMGLRLPLDSIPWVAEKEYPWHWTQDPSAALPSLPREFPYRARPDLSRQRFLAGGSAPYPAGYGPGQRAQGPAQPLPPLPEADPTRRPQQGESAPWIIRTALCVQPREGRLHVFMPPVNSTEDYLDLVAALETTATELGLPVVIEGEAPPKDPRLTKLAVTPDPGVIEVNLHPSKSWDELVERTTVLYDEARRTRLGTEKFMLDGRHTGTGGGNHIIIGGETPGDSPILRRPDLLRSLLGYWQNHPSLSWLFSGTFIGPTSQAPRVDEARNDSLRELEIAFKELDRQLLKGSCPPWLVDRLFRHLLADATGNTHRAEFSIDKLFAPESATGRLGLVELRAFEMPPHARMSLAQHLLLRGLVAKFWEQPYTNGLVRWGTDIHDRWLLPHYWRGRFRRRHRRPARRGLRVRKRLVRPALRVPLPPRRRLHRPRRPGRTARRARALARPGRGARRRRHRPLRRQLARAAPGQGLRPHRRPLRPHRQRPPHPAAPDRHQRPGRRGRALPRLAAAGSPAADDRRARPAGVRPHRHLEQALARRLHLPRCPSGRTQLRDLPGQFLRGREPAPRAVFRPRAHARRAAREDPAGREAGSALHAGSAGSLSAAQARVEDS